MHIPTQHAKKTTNTITTLALYSLIAFTPVLAGAQMTMPPSQPAQSQAQPDAATQTRDMQAQISELKQQVAQLQAALQQSKVKKTNSQKGAMNPAQPAMVMEGDAGEMGTMPPDASKPPMGPMKGKMGAMPADASKPPMGPMKGKMSGMADDKMKGMSNGTMPPKSSNAMSGSKTMEAPHLLHVGAKNFFLDYAQHIGLTPEQKTSLEGIKSVSMQQKATSQKQIEVAEQELWQLTSADQPNAVDIDKKVQETTKLRADQQMTFIHSVSMAANVLTPDQRVQVVSTTPSTNAAKSSMKKPMKM